MSTNEDFAERYSRQIVLKDFGEAAQQRLAAAKVLVIGAGGLGVAALQYLTAAGVGRIGVADGDTIALSNLQRQVIYATDAVGMPKAAEAIRYLSALNPDVVFHNHPFIEPSNALQVIREYDLVIDATDNFSSRYLINDACVLTDKPLIHGSVSGFEGQLAVFNWGTDRTHYRDLFPEMPGAGESANCEAYGVLGVLPGIIGVLQAAEAIKIITGKGKPMANTLLTFNLLRNEWLQLRIFPSATVPAGMPATAVAFENTNYEVSCAAEYTDIGPDRFDELINREEIRVIDVREEGEYPPVDFEHTRLSLSDLKSKAGTYHGQTLVLFCQVGLRSVTAAGLFPADNVIYNLKGGIVKWMHRRRPSPKS